jgi:hypothetical protein
LQSDDFGAPMDVLWFRITRKGGDDPETFGHIEAGALLVMLDRGDYLGIVAVPRRPHRRDQKLR